MDRLRRSEVGRDLRSEDARSALPRSKFEVWGEEMIEKEDKSCLRCRMGELILKETGLQFKPFGFPLID